MTVFCGIVQSAEEGRLTDTQCAEAKSHVENGAGQRVTFEYRSELVYLVALDREHFGAAARQVGVEHARLVELPEVPAQLGDLFFHRGRAGLGDRHALLGRHHPLRALALAAKAHRLGFGARAHHRVECVG